jgi:hypothetical protein
MTLTNVSGTQIPEQPAGEVFENNTWSWTVNTDINDTSVHLALDNSLYTDPVTNQQVRCSSSGLVHFNTNGSMDYVVYQDRNAEHFGTETVIPTPVYNDPNIPGGTPAVEVTDWLNFTDADPLNRSIIGFDGATVPANSVFVPGGNPWGNAQTFDLSKLPIVLCYQQVDNTGGASAVIPTTPVPPSGTSAGTSVALDIAGQFLATANPAAQQNWYVQAIDIDWGTVSTITGGQFDDAGAVGDLANSDDVTGSPDTILRS